LISFLLTPGQESDVTLAKDLMKTGSILRQSGHLHLYPKRLVADKGYTSSAFRSYLHQRNIRCTIPHFANEHHKGIFNKQMDHKRNIFERLINRLKQFRRIATRYERRAANSPAMITLASIFLFSDFAYRL
jgi:transposase